MQHHANRQKPKLRPSRQRLKLTPTKPEPADPVVTRLMLDIQLACRSKHKVACGLIDQDALGDADALERGAFQHLFNYLNAKAWVRSKPDDM
jgi:hypothetical protein